MLGEDSRIEPRTAVAVESAWVWEVLAHCFSCFKHCNNNSNSRRRESDRDSMRLLSASYRKGRRKEKDVDTTNKPYLADDLVTKRISNVDLERLVEAPQGLDYNEWLATHTISFFEHLNLLYGSVSEYCNSTVCSSMSGPNNMQYLWVDGKGKKCKCAAPQYVDYVMLTTEQTLNDEAIFPTKYGNTFPATFECTVRRVLTWLYHVLAHLYHAHYKEVAALCLHPHLNTLFLHFCVFSKRHTLLEDKELEALEDLYEKLRQPPKPSVVIAPATSRSTENIVDEAAAAAAAAAAAGDGKVVSSSLTSSPVKEMLPLPKSSLVMMRSGSSAQDNKENSQNANAAKVKKSSSSSSPPTRSSRSSTSSSSSSCGGQQRHASNGQAAAASASMS